MSASWDWQGDVYYPQKDSNLDMPHCEWNDSDQNEEGFSYMLEDAISTPVKACGDISYHNESGNISKAHDESKETYSQVKRRRLQFENELIDQTLPMEDISTSYLKSKEKIDFVDYVEEALLPWEAGFEEDISPTIEGMDQTESWLAECLNDTEMLGSSSAATTSGRSGVRINISGYCNIQTDTGAKIVEKRAVRSSRNIIFKGRKSYMPTPTKAPSSVAYPFTFVKPCDVDGGMTLKDINQKLRTPPPSKSIKEDLMFPKSAITGKPVVGKTKIRTEGGKGSITIMRTKG